MAGIKITDLPSVPSAQLTDVFPVDQGLTTYKESNSQLLTLFKSNGEALTSVNDTNVTMTLGGSPTISLLNATSMTLGWTGTLSGTRGGTGVNNGASTITLGGSLTTSGAFASTFTMTNTTSVTFPTSGTLATTSQIPTGSALTKADDTNVTLTLGGSPTTALVNAASITAGWTGTLSGARGGTGVANTGSTITVGGNFAMSGAFAFTGTLTNTTAVTFPTSGTLATTSQLPSPAALTKSDDTNVTLTLGGTPTTALLQATSIAAGWTGTLSGTRGGTGINNGSNTATFAGNLNFASSFTTSGAFAVTQTYTGITNVTFPTSGTLATTSQIPTGAALTKVDDTNVTLTLGGSPTTALVNAASITAGWTGQLGLTRGGTNASLTANNGGIVYSNASSLAVLAGTATAGQMLQSGASTTPAWSTSTYPQTNAVNTLLYASSANVMGALATANSSILVTDSSGVPAWGTTLPAFTTSSITFNPSTSGIVGTTTNNAASAGFVGEVQTANASGVSLVNATAKTVTSISLTAGDWDVWGNIVYTPAASTTMVQFFSCLSLTNNTAAINISTNSQYLTYTTGNVQYFPVGLMRFSLASTTTIYLVGYAQFAISTLTADGEIFARRRR